MQLKFRDRRWHAIKGTPLALNGSQLSHSVRCSYPTSELRPQHIVRALRVCSRTDLSCLRAAEEVLVDRLDAEEVDGTGQEEQDNEQLNAEH